MHQLVAEAHIGPCPPGHKLVHLNGNGLDNHLANLAYVPLSDPRPAAPLKPRRSGQSTEAVATGYETVVLRRQRHKGKRKRR